MATTKQAAMPSLTKAVRIAQYGGSELLKYEEVPLPEIGSDHVLAKVRYAGVNPGGLENPRRLQEAGLPGELSADAGARFHGRNRKRRRWFGPFPDWRAAAAPNADVICSQVGAFVNEETQRTLLCSDLFHQIGDVEPLSSADVVGRSRQAMKEYQVGILAEYVPYTPLTEQNLKKLAYLSPKPSPSCIAQASQVTAPKHSMTSM
jgi:hypothetical protein